MIPDCVNTDCSITLDPQSCFSCKTAYLCRGFDTSPMNAYPFLKSLRHFLVILLGFMFIFLGSFLAFGKRFKVHPYPMIGWVYLLAGAYHSVVVTSEKACGGSEVLD